MAISGTTECILVYTFRSGEIVNPINAVAIDVQLQYMSPLNMPTKKVEEDYRRMKGGSLERREHCKILDEIVARDGLECDPTIDYVDYDDDDNSYVCDSGIESDVKEK